jgi:hypothetical protein
VLPVAPLCVAREQQVLPGEAEQHDKTLIVERVVSGQRMRLEHVGLRIL